MKACLSICVFLLSFSTVTSLLCYEREATHYYSSCGFWGLDRCRRTRYRQRAVCCGGWAGSTGDSCPLALCAGLTNPTACNKVEGNVKMSASGPVYTESGGSCDSPDGCVNCNPGYYTTGQYCRACTEIDNCHYSSCTDSTNSVCQYCKGVVRDDETQYGWWAFNRWMDGGLSCKTACSWRNGSRCYPGSCSDTTHSSCQCEPGFGGTDCTTITDSPTILGSFVRLKQINGSSIELVEAPREIANPSPQQTVYTNHVDLQTGEAYVDAQYVKALPSTPDNFYVKHEGSLVGIVDGGVSLKLERGSVTSETLRVECPKTTPVPNNYRCDGTLDIKDKWSSSFYPLENGDRIIFSTYATNGGYITVYDREDNDNEVQYEIQGETLTYEFVVEIDTISPDHCARHSGTCADKPLDVTDIIVENNEAVIWEGWDDASAGVESYHFSVFHLRSTGPGTTSLLEHGESAESAVLQSVAASTTETSLTLPSPGPYSVVMSVFDKAGNHRSVRRLLLFDDQSVVDKQGVRTVVEGANGQCTWSQEPAAPIIYTANPDANCEWIVQDGPVVIAWKDHFINTRHVSGQWLNPVSAYSEIDASLDDNDGQMSLAGTDNVKGIVKFRVSYNQTFEGQTTTVPWTDVLDLHSQSMTLNDVLMDGMSFNITIRGVDITGAYADESVYVKVDTSPPQIRNLWLVAGNFKNVSIHKLDDLSKLKFEWEAEDFHSGIHSVEWRIFNNYTGADFVHGTAYKSPQGNVQSMDQCEEVYGSYPGGPNCYCTPYDGCYHKHFEVSPMVDNDGTNGLALDRITGVHDADYFVEVVVYNKAMLKTVLSSQITIDVSPPSPGVVLEGTRGSPEIDYQQDSTIHVHWKDFYDRESGVLFYDYTYGDQCYGEDAFSLNLDYSGVAQRTYEDFASFTVASEGTYYVTVVAYNHALDASAPVCSDSITIDSTIPSVFRVSVKGSTTDARPLITDDDNIWYLTRNRTIQLVEEPSDSCRSKALYISQSQLTMYGITTDSQGTVVNMKHLDCDNDVYPQEITSYIRMADKMEIIWETDDQVYLHDTEIGLASPSADIPDIMEYESVHQHTSKHLNGLELVDGQMLQILIRTTSKSGVVNIQKVGPFIVDSSPPSFHGEISVTTGPGSMSLLASWDVGAFTDSHIGNELLFQYAIGTYAGAIDVHGFQDLEFNDAGVESGPPTCTIVNMDTLDWSIHHQHAYYISVRATNKVGLSVTATSREYVHYDHIPSYGVVLDRNDDEMDYNRQDADCTLSTTELKAEWFGFSSSGFNLNYTICQAKDNVVIESTCVNVSDAASGAIQGLTMNHFEVYQVAVIARSRTYNVTVYSDGIMPVDINLNLDLINVYDGPNCSQRTEIPQEKFQHHEQYFSFACQDDVEYQRSMNALFCHWTVPGDYSKFTPDVKVKVQKRAPIADYWEDISKDKQIMASTLEISTNIQLDSGSKYRCMLTFCANKFCFPSRHTSGVTITHFAPTPGNLAVDYENNDIGSKLKITLDKFMDPDIEDTREAIEAISHYEWSIADGSGNVLFPWSRCENMQDLNDKQLYFEEQLDKVIQFTACWRFAVRGYNHVGLFSTVSADIHDCNDGTTVRDPLVLDSVGPSVILEDGSVVGGNITYTSTQPWTEEDQDFTPFDNVVSAVWPKQRYPNYSFAVIEMDLLEPILHFEESSTLNIRNPCDVPNRVACGQTNQNFINVHSTLSHGKRYAVCIHAESTTLHHELWDEMLAELNVCSDGITVDIKAPTPGAVYIEGPDILYQLLHTAITMLDQDMTETIMRTCIILDMTTPTPGAVYIDGPNILYQNSLSDVLVIWENFVDVEELSYAPYASGIAYYEVALGTHAGGSDVRNFQRVAPTNHFIFHDLNLQNGYKYYTTVKGYDFTDKFSSAHSSPIVVDHTPPALTDERIFSEKRYFTNRDSIHVCWNGLFSDAESGIASYTYTIGSHPGYSDILTPTQTMEQCSDSHEGIQLILEEGVSFFFTVTGTNGAGLSTTSSSWAFIADYSPPVIGYLYDGVREVGKDIDYQTDKHTLKAFWSGFHDPHTSLKKYFIKVGSDVGSDDLVRDRNIGMREEISLPDLHLIEGQRYYVTLTTCNTAGLCSTATTDGVMVDSSPPIPGNVIDGPYVNDMDYQSSRTYVVSKWYGFVDTQSGISHFTWRLGTLPGADDLVHAIQVPVSDEIVIQDLSAEFGVTLPVNKRIFATVRGYNKAGLWSESSSNGFMVDTDPPVFLTQLSLSSTGSITETTSMLSDLLQVSWNVQDNESFIDKQYLTVTSHLGEDFNVSVQIPGLIRDHTFSNIKLHDGSLYDIHLWACNSAELCSNSAIENVLVDSSMPTAGSFAISTERTADRGITSDWMAWTHDSITLALVGFSDEHSGLSTYHVNIGSEYMGNDLNKDTDSTIELEHNDDTSNTWSDRGKVQIFNVDTVDISQYQHIFITVWAENGVGLQSDVIHSQFILEPNGEMELVRQCTSYSCQGHCVCAAEDIKCPTDSNVACEDVTNDPAYSKLTVLDLIQLRDEADDKPNTHTPTKTMLSASWQVDDEVNIQPIWYEWSVGLSENTEPQGIFTNDERIWHDAAMGNKVVFTLNSDHPLHDGESYSVFIRAWYSGSQFATFKSPGVMIQTQKPQITNLFGKSVKETSSASGSTDVDYVDLQHSLFVNWTGVFKESSDLLMHYNVYLSQSSYGHGYEILKHVPVTTTFTELSLSDLNIHPGIRYYSNVQVYTRSGMHTTAVSDGFIIDTDIPRSGVVFDGLGIHDLKYQNHSDEISAHWYGFTDIHSSIVSYTWCVSSAGNEGSCDIVASINVGMKTSVGQLLSPGIENDQKVISEVFATDAAGHNSELVKSNGVTIDTTAPVPLSLTELGDNLINNPSFEQADTAIEIENFSNPASCVPTNIPYWALSGCSVVLRGNMKDGLNSLWLRGNASQAITTLPGRSYSLSFYVAYPPSSANKYADSYGEISIQLGEEKHVHFIHPRPNNRDPNSITWQFVSTTFEATTESTVLIIETMSKSNGLMFDDVELLEMDEITEEGGNQVRLQTALLQDFSSLHAAWKFEDGESGITNYMWAIGTVRGGVQLQTFKSVGPRQSATNSDIDLQHGADIFVTVVATNGAGLKAVVYSEPLLIDRTPPVISVVNDGHIYGEDIDFLDANEVPFTFEAEDEESGLKLCWWALGVNESPNFVTGYMPLQTDSNSGIAQIPAGTDTSRPFIVTIKCENNAGLVTEKRSDGAQILMAAPDITNVVVEVLGSSETQYPVVDPYHGDTEELRVKWSGFKPKDKVKSFKLDLIGTDYVKTFDVIDSGTLETFVTLIGLQFHPGSYSCSLTGVNVLGIESDVIVKNFTVVKAVPTLTEHSIQITWNRETEIATANWSNVFYASNPIYYEVSIGTERYGNNIVMLQETMSTEIDFTLHKSVVGEFGKEIFVVVTAISTSGTYSSTSTSQLIN